MKKQFLTALIFAVLASLFIGLYFFDIGRHAKSMSEPVKAVVAAVRIERGSVIEHAMLKEKILPKEFAQPKYVSDIRKFIVNDKPGYMAVVSFEEGEQITAGKIISVNSDAGIANAIPDGKKAITLAFSKDEVYGILMPGSRIDLISVIDYESKDRTVVEAAGVIAQNLLVLAVGENRIGGTSDLNREQFSGNVPVSLAVSVNEAQTIFLAQEKGIIKTVLRPASDNETINVAPVRINDIFSDASYSKSVLRHQNADQKTLKEIQRNQKEAYEILSRYSK